MQRLILKDIQPGGGEVVALQRFHQRFLVHHLTACRIDENRTLLHQGKFFRPDHLPGFLGQDDMEADDVGFFQQCLQIDPFRIAENKSGFFYVGIIGEDSNPPRRHQIGKTATDPSQADNTDGDARITVLLFAEINALERRIAPFALLYGFVSFSYFFKQRKHDCNGALSDTGPVGFCGGVGHQDTPLRGRINIYVIHSNRSIWQ